MCTRVANELLLTLYKEICPGLWGYPLLESQAGVGAARPRLVTGFLRERGVGEADGILVLELPPRE